MVGDEQVGYFQNVAEDLSSELARTNPACGQGGIWPLSLRITSLTL